MHGVTFGQFQHLRNLWVEDGLTQAELSRRIGIEMASSTAILDSLEAAKLITRVRNAADRRKINVFLTPAGAALEKALMACAADANKRASKGLSTSRGRSAVRAGRADHREFQDLAGRRCIFRKGGRAACAETAARDSAARTGASEHAAGGGVSSLTCRATS